MTENEFQLENLGKVPVHELGRRLIPGKSVIPLSTIVGAEPKHHALYVGRERGLVGKSSYMFVTLEGGLVVEHACPPPHITAAGTRDSLEWADEVLHLKIFDTTVLQPSSEKVQATKRMFKQLGDYGG
jgi:hypothetical protein